MRLAEGGRLKDNVGPGTTRREGGADSAEKQEEADDGEQRLGHGQGISPIKKKIQKNSKNQKLFKE